MGNAQQPFDGPNGRYSICSKCGHKYGTPPEGGIGMWMGKCDFCGREAWLSNALHDWNITEHPCGGEQE